MYMYICIHPLPLPRRITLPRLTLHSRTLGFTLVNLLDRLSNALAVDEMRDAVPRQPAVLGHDEVRDEREDGHAGHDDGGVYKTLINTHTGTS